MLYLYLIFVWNFVFQVLVHLGCFFPPFFTLFIQARCFLLFLSKFTLPLCHVWIPFHTFLSAELLLTGASPSVLHSLTPARFFQFWSSLPELWPDVVMLSLLVSYHIYCLFSPLTVENLVVSLKPIQPAVILLGTLTPKE